MIFNWFEGAPNDLGIAHPAKSLALVSHPELLLSPDNVTLRIESILRFVSCAIEKN
jgi:hypothetical protein